VLPATRGRLVRGVGRRAAYLVEAVLVEAGLFEAGLFDIRWGSVVDTPHHLAARLQAPTDLASRECARAVPARARARIASPDPRRRSKTYRKGTWGVGHPNCQQTGLLSACLRHRKNRNHRY
jgi:hypothetical protein